MAVEEEWQPTVMALTVMADMVATLSLVTLACIEDGPLTAALLPRAPSLELSAAANVLDLLLASALRGAATFLFVGCGGAACAARAPSAGLAAAGAAHAAAAAWLAAKAALGVRLAGGDAATGRLEAGGATLRVAALLATELLGIVLSGVLLVETISFRHVLRRRAPPDALAGLAPLSPDAREWLECRHQLVARWVDEAGPSASPPPGRTAWHKAHAAAPGAGAAAAAAAVSRPPPAQVRSGRAVPAAVPGTVAAVAAELGQPLLAERSWGSDSGSDAMQSAASHAAPSSSTVGGASFVTATSEGE